MAQDDCRAEGILKLRQSQRRPWHSPPHLDLDANLQYLVTAACYEHECIIGKSSDRMTECEDELLKVVHELCSATYAWCVLPNHYHLLLKTERIKDVRRALAQLHGRSSYCWNSEDTARGRKVWFNCFERPMKSERHLWASLNYVHHNPVHHGYVAHWQDWPWSSAADFLWQMGREKAEAIWRKCPILEYGKKWDVY
jgi:REP-associated tyrosine transposase